MLSPKTARRVYAVELAIKLMDSGIHKSRIRGMIVQRLGMDRTTAQEMVNIALEFR